VTTTRKSRSRVVVAVAAAATCSATAVVVEQYCKVDLQSKEIQQHDDGENNNGEYNVRSLWVTQHELNAMRKEMKKGGRGVS
jgi:hypothetical protein